MRLPLIAGNWKMYKTAVETEAFLRDFIPLVAESTHCEICIAPPYTSIAKAVEMVKGTNVFVSAQDVFWEKQGAFTGEVSGAMLKDAGCRYAIIGHSERRQFFGETNDSVNRKLNAALAAGVEAIVCVGELLQDRESGKTEDVLRQQVEQGFRGLTAAQFDRIIVAYEPVWAIGTGRTATPEIAEDAHRFIRTLLEGLVGKDTATTVRVLYGGSVKPDNIKGLMSQVDIDGALVGGASLEAKSFAAIVNY